MQLIFELPSTAVWRDWRAAARAIIARHPNVRLAIDPEAATLVVAGHVTSAEAERSLALAGVDARLVEASPAGDAALRSKPARTPLAMRCQAQPH